MEGRSWLDGLSSVPEISVLVTDRYLPTLAGRLPEEVPTYVVADALVDSIVGFPFHRGVIACGERQAWPSLDEIVERAGCPRRRSSCPRLSNPDFGRNRAGSATSSRYARFWQARHARTRYRAGCSESRWDPGLRVLGDLRFPTGSARSPAACWRSSRPVRCCGRSGPQSRSDAAIPPADRLGLVLGDETRGSGEMVGKMR